MTVSLLHATVATGTDAGNGSIHKAEWNQEHAITMATGKLLGRTTAGTGAVEEITASTGLTLTAGALAVSKAFPTGDIVGTTDTQNLSNKTFTDNPTFSAGTANGILYLNGSKVATSGSALVFDGTNLGIGVTPSAWDATTKALQFSLGAVGSSSGLGTTLNLNSYYNGAWRYQASGVGAMLYSQVSAGHQWLTAPSGTAGNAISFTQAMTLDSSGNLGIGTSSPSKRLQVVDNQNAGTGFLVSNNSAGASAQTQINFTNGTHTHTLGIAGTNYTTYGVLTANSGFLYTGGNQDLALAADGTGVIKFGTGVGVPEKMRLDSSGNLGIGVTPSAWRTDRKALQVNYASLYAGNTGNYAVVGNNIYVDSAGAARYISNAVGSSYVQDTSGAHNWNIFTGNTGAGNAPTTSNQAMTLDASGRLLVGTSVSPSSSSVRQVLSGASGAQDAYLQLAYGGGGGGYVASATGAGIIFGTYTGAVGSESYSAEHARIDASGNLNIAGLTASKAVFTDASKNLTSTGTLGVNQGGTGLTAGTSGGVLYYSAAGTLASSAALAANSLLIGGGAGVAPSSITTGTGVVTALGVNTGSAGAFVVNGGALGTPSSGTVTNLTGTASININGTVGATTPNTGAFTSITSTSASGVLTRAAATQDGVELIGRAGGTTSLKVTFTPTTLTASRTITLPDATGVAVLDSATQTLTNKTLTDPAIVGAILEDVYTIVDGAAFEVDPGNGTIQLVTLGANRTPKATNFAAGESVQLLVNDGTAYTITWTDATWGTGGVVWVGGVAPALATTGYTVLEFWKVGTQVYGALVGSVA